MTVSRADRPAQAPAPNSVRRPALRRVLSLALTAFAVAGASVDAAAQTNAPIRLGPIEPPASAAPAAPDAAVPVDGVRGGTGIVVQRLGGVDSEAIGVLLPGQGGLDATVWNGASRGLVADLLTRVPGTVASPPLRELVRRLLLTTAPPPLAEDSASVSLVAARVDLLLAMGATDDAEALIAAAGRRAPTSDLAWPTFEARLLAGDIAGACRIPRERSGNLAGIDWQKALIFCQLVAEQTDQAQFGLSLLRERGIDDDPLFYAIADALAAGGKPDLDSLDMTRETTPLDLAMLRLAWTAPPAGFLDRAPAGIAAAIAATPDLSETGRLAAALRAEAAGAMSPADLRNLLASVKATNQELAAALTIADSETPARAVALLYLAARAQQVPAARAEVLQRLWEIAAEEGMSGTAGRLVTPLLDDIPLLAEFSWFAGTAARIALYGGDQARALGWYEVAAAAASTDSTADAVAAGLWPLVRLALGDVRRLPAERPPVPAADAAPPVTIVAGGSQTVRDSAVAITQTLPPQGAVALPWDRARLDRWLIDDAEQHPDKARLRAGRLLAMLDAVGDPVPDTFWRDTLPATRDAAPASVTTAASAYRLGLDRAVRAGRQGETLLFAAATLAGQGTGTIEPASLHAVVRALTEAGFPVEARAVAVEAALSGGL